MPGGYLFRNDTPNDLFQAVNFGGLLSFDLNFAGAIDPLSLMASHFTVSAVNEAFAPLGNYDSRRGSLADFVWTPAIAAGVDGNIGVSISDGAVTFIPEPGKPVLRWRERWTPDGLDALPCDTVLAPATTPGKLAFASFPQWTEEMKRAARYRLCGLTASMVLGPPSSANGTASAIACVPRSPGCKWSPLS